MPDRTALHDLRALLDIQPDSLPRLPRKAAGALNRCTSLRDESAAYEQSIEVLDADVRERDANGNAGSLDHRYDRESEANCRSTGRRESKAEDEVNPCEQPNLADALKVRRRLLTLLKQRYLSGAE
ncbi:hypothetical protein [Microvirga tunisiensis]|uniref:Uncharacterized protein n=1 Tax=Microvirga tunisiensis TaxID=2108360 RepID=A0A5N7MHL2_9HYPH|nr:hypothetical protein [Microvirga tunisiensis]MPR07825.1 hypothetical protein [Microvirga tunisiensis]MPR26220.1 hypothetical protein [Microvirga tunisiensis]